MLTSEHLLVKIAYARGEDVDNWVTAAENIIDKCSTSEEVVFGNTFDIQLASFLLIDNLLPLPGVKALSNVMFNVIQESYEKKYTMESLYITPPKSGRKENKIFLRIVFHEVREHLEKGLSKKEAYMLVAEKHSKSPDTIRRIVERINKKLAEEARNKK